MKDNNPYSPPKTELDDSNKDTYTDHPAYQEPIKRSTLHITVRKIFGILLIVLAAMLVVLASIRLLTATYALLTGNIIIDGTWASTEYLLRLIISIIIPSLIAFGLFQYGRHLTRPNSREYV